MKLRRRTRKAVSIYAGLLLIVAAGSTTPALAQTDAGDTGDAANTASAQDKSGYTLFNPTPDDQLRAFCTDRPPTATLPCTVDAGHF
jgi:hypothetical protein